MTSFHNRDLFADPAVPVFSTSEYARTIGISPTSASHRLRRYAQAGFLTRVTRGLWAKVGHPKFTPLSCVSYLLGKEQGYVSFLTALHRHGLLSQIPMRVHVASTGHGRVLHSEVGTFEFFHLHPRMMMDGVEWSATKPAYRMATVEKALLDVFYLSFRKGRRFSRLPELDAGDVRLDKKRFAALLKEQVSQAGIQRAILSRLHTLRPSCVNFR